MPPVSWNEIRIRAHAFVAKWKDESSERAEAQSFWNEFFEVFGVSRRRVASFEKRVPSGKSGGYADLLWKGVLIVEHKSRGEDLEKAHQQAVDYFPGIRNDELPRYIVVCDFARFCLYDMEQDGKSIARFNLEQLPDNVDYFGFIAGYQRTEVKPDDPVNIKAAEKMAVLHDRLKNAGYAGHDLEVMLVRLLFCLFAEDTGVFERNLFHDLLLNHTKTDGSDLGMALAQLFETLNTPREKRHTVLPRHFADFSYINGKLFEERLAIASFDSQMRQALLDATSLNWGKISPAIFGSLFQGVMDAEARRNLGAHYTSEANILKVVGPLFMESLKAEFEQCRGSRIKLERFHSKLASLKFLDPACGCGNFLVITYRELRLLELAVLNALRALQREQQMPLDVAMTLLKVNVDQFYGIEQEEFPAQIAQVALWLTDHQMNLKVSELFGQYYARLPLTKAPKIVCANALTLPWESVVKPGELDFILGNPPFGGSKCQSAQQRAETVKIAQGIKSAGILDFVTGWYFLAAQFIQNTTIEVGFVSTNSITQGEQVGVLWPALLNKGIVINFAHRTFEWTSDARGKAAVHCVIIGFSTFPRKNKIIFSYDNPKSEPVSAFAGNINPYLVDGPFVVLPNRRTPLCQSPAMGIGNKPIDGGNFLFEKHEMEDFIAKEPGSAEFFRQWMGAEEFLNNKQRWCLWLGDCPADKLRKMPLCMERVKRVREYRLASKSLPTQKLAETPTRFHVENMPTQNFLVIPKVSSERREYIPIGFLSPEIFCSDLLFITKSASLFHFGVLSSAMHMAWMRHTAGRLESRYRYSVGIVYNNFPWPLAASQKQSQAVMAAAENVLEQRSLHKESSLADLYDPLAMPKDLRKAHNALDRAVDKCYRPQAFASEAARVEFLFVLYDKIVSENTGWQAGRLG